MRGCGTARVDDGFRDPQRCTSDRQTKLADPTHVNTRASTAKISNGKFDIDLSWWSRRRRQTAAQDRTARP